jgi:hypothetical protein
MRRMVGIAALGAMGAWTAYAMIDGRAKNDLHSAPAVVAALYIGAAILAALPFATGFTDRIAPKAADFWSVPGWLARATAAFAFGISAALGWQLLILVVTG